MGREAEFREVFRAFKSVGVLMTGERRMGKTSLARLVAQDAQSRDWQVVWQSAEGFPSLADFTGALVSAFERAEGPIARAARALKERWGFRAGGVEILPVHVPRFLDDVVSSAVSATDTCLLLVLDELPILARGLELHQAGDGVAMLHALRRQRQEHPERLRMLCLGSIGFHHVLRAGSDGSLNDLDSHRLGPLSLNDATYLAACLLRGASVSNTNEGEVALAIAEQVEGVPYYVHHVVASALKRPSSGPIGPHDIEALVAQALTSPDDPWELRHYRDRIKRYFGEDASLARAILDEVATEDGGLTLDGIAARLSASPALAPVDRERIRDVVERLEGDHYLVRDGDRRRFALSLVRRAWQENRR